MTPEIRNRILAAAARVYAQYGFRGATTRLIASQASVNEVTIFRTFGSKAELLEAMLQSQVSATDAPVLDGDLDDPGAVLTDWCARMLQYLRGHSHLVRKTIAEADERPDAACVACEGPNAAGSSLAEYVARLRETGLADRDTDVQTAVSMFMSAMFGDALYRDVMPNAFPQPVHEAPAKYVRTFLRAVGVRAASLPGPTRLAGTGQQRRVAGTRRRSR